MSEIPIVPGARRSKVCSPRPLRWRGCLGVVGAMLAGFPADGALAAVHVGEPTEELGPGRTDGMVLFAQAGPGAKSTITVASTIVGEPAGEAPFAMRVAGDDAPPSGSYIRIRGLPPLASMSEGFAIAPSLWAVPLASLPKLRLKLPPKAKGDIALSIALVTVEGRVLVETKTTVAVGSQGTTATLQSGLDARPRDKSAPTVQSALPPVTLEQTSSRIASAIIPRGPAEPPPPPPDPQAAAEEVPLTNTQRRALRFISRGQEMFGEGNVSSARLLFKRAADAGLAYGALFLGQTYDPNELAIYKVRGLGGNLAEAKAWYERAYALGAPEADELLRRLGAR